MENLEKDDAGSMAEDIQESKEDPTKLNGTEKDCNLPPKKRRRCTIATIEEGTAEAKDVSSDTSSHSVPSIKAAGRKRASSIPSTASSFPTIDLTGNDGVSSASAVIDLTKETIPSWKNTVCSNDTYHSISFSPHLAMFVLKHTKTIGGHGLPFTVFTSAQQGGIKICGPREDVSRAQKLLQAITWHGDRLFYNCPELSSYFSCDSWKDFLKVLESEIRCVIEVKRKDTVQEIQQMYNSNQPITDSPFIQHAVGTTTNPVQSSRCVGTFSNLLKDGEITFSENIQTNESHSLPPQTPVDMRTNPTPFDQHTSPLPFDISSQQKPDKAGNLSQMLTSETKYGNLSVIVSHGDIVQDNSAAIVNGVNSNFDLSYGAVSKAIVAGAGTTIIQACQFADSSNPLLRVTSGYDLQCKYVFHLVTPRSIDNYAHSLMQALLCAEKFQLPSIALPALGTGDIGLNPLEVSNRTVEAINKFVASQVRFVKTIKLVIFNTNLFFIFRSNIVTSKAVGGYGYRRAVEVDAEITRRNTSLGMVIDICSDQKESVTMEVNMRLFERCVAVEADNSTLLPLIVGVSATSFGLTKDDDLSYSSFIKNCLAMERVQKHMEKCIRKKSINRELILKLNNHDCIDIYLASVPYSTAVTYSASQITLVGLPDNLEKLHDFVRGIGFEIREAEALSKICSWQWEIGFDCFEGLPIRVSAELEKLYERHLQDKTLAMVRLYGETFYVDFTAMIYEFNSVFGRIRRLNHKQELPQQWSDMKGNSMLRVPLDPHASPEYGNVLNQFLNSSPQFKNVVQIERIQNPALYKQYMVKKADVEAHMTSGLPVERNLFHGTSESDAMKICTDGFDRGFAGKNATMFGKGTYFAVESSYSMRFAHGPNGSVRMMFLASVLTGDYCQGSSNYKAAPEKGAPSNRRYDSVVDRVTNPTMYVVFKDSSVYPSYLIHFV